MTKLLLVLTSLFFVRFNTNLATEKIYIEIAGSTKPSLAQDERNVSVLLHDTFKLFYFSTDSVKCYLDSMKIASNWGGIKISEYTAVNKVVYIGKGIKLSDIVPNNTIKRIDIITSDYANCNGKEKRIEGNTHKKTFSIMVE